ncbi:MAG: CvpA family protein [Puia sp.]|nr:CvpA family protein [Puia sp.]
MIIDILFAICLILAVFRGIQQGLIIAVFSVLAIVIGLAAAIKLSALVAGYLKGTLHVSAKWLPLLAFLLVYGVVSLLVIWSGRFLELTIDLTLMGWVNKLGGIVLYMALYCVVFSVFLFYAAQLHIFRFSVISSSLVYPYVQPWGPAVIDAMGKVIPLFKGMFTELEDFFDHLGRRYGH